MVLGGLKMQIDVGYFYFIKDSFFDIIDDSEFKSVQLNLMLLPKNSMKTQVE